MVFLILTASIINEKVTSASEGWLLKRGLIFFWKVLHLMKQHRLKCPGVLDNVVNRQSNIGALFLNYLTLLS